MSLGNSLKFPLSDCDDVQTGRARRGNARLGAHMTQQLRSLENGARKRGGAMKQLEGAVGTGQEVDAHRVAEGIVTPLRKRRLRAGACGSDA